MRRIIMSVLMAAILLPLTVDPAMAQTQTEQVNYRCTKPTTGSYAVRFVWRVMYPDSLTIYSTATSTDSFAALTVPKRSKVWAIVAGVDATNRQGPWSPFGSYDPGAPGACGRPVRN